MKKERSKLSISGPMQDGQFTVWMVRGPRGGFVAEFFTREDARRFIKGKRTATRRRKELASATKN